MTRVSTMLLSLFHLDYSILWCQTESA